MANIILYKNRSSAFFASSYRFRDIHISKIRDLENVDQGNDVQRSQWRYSIANTELFFFLYLHFSRIVKSLTLKIRAE